MVYIQEAHTIDNWPAGLELEIEQPKTFNDRLDCVKLLHDKYNILFDVYVDNMNNDFNNIYASWPYRYWIIDSISKKLIIKTMPDKDNYFTIDQLVEWLNTL